MKTTSLPLAFLAGTSSVLAANSTTLTLSTSLNTTHPLFIHIPIPCGKGTSFEYPRHLKSDSSYATLTATATITPTTFTTVTITPAVKMEDRNIAEAEKAKKDKGDDCMSTSYSEFKGAVITFTKPYLKGCKTRPTGSVQNVGFHG